MELYYNCKVDVFSGICIKIVELMEELGKSFNFEEVDEYEFLVGCCGG